MITLTLAMDRAAGTGTAAIKEGEVGTIFDFTFEQDAIAGAATEAATLALDKLTAALADPPDGKTVIARSAVTAQPAKPAAKKTNATQPKGKAAVDDDGFAQVDMFAVPAATTPAPAATTAPATVDVDIFAVEF